MEKINSNENLIRLIERHGNLVFSICLRLTGDYFVSEDIMQETFITVYQHWSEFDGTSEKAWLCRIAANKCIDWRRAADRRRLVLSGELPEVKSDDNQPLRELLNREVMVHFEECIDRLKEPYRSVARSHFIDGNTAREIACSSGLGLKAVQSRILRARNMLKKAIRREELLE